MNEQTNDWTDDVHCQDLFTALKAMKIRAQQEVKQMHDGLNTERTKRRREGKERGEGLTWEVKLWSF